MKVPMLLLSLLVVAAAVSPWQLPTAAAWCQRQCGGVDIPYPFGIGRGCYLDSGDGKGQPFELTCSNRTSDGLLRPITTVDEFEVLQIDVLQGKMRVRSPISTWCPGRNQPTLTYHSSAFRFSGAVNRLIVVGCNASAYVDMWDSDFDNWYRVACQAVCLNEGTRPPPLADSRSCNGTDGCCQAPIPPRIMYFRMRFSFSDEGGGNSSSGVAATANSSACSYAMLVEEAAFEFPTTYLTSPEHLDASRKQVCAVLDWTAGKETCREAQKNTTAYACVSANHECLDSDNGPGYLCSCAKGYQGNPYLLGGCQDIDECKAAAYRCSAFNMCRNTPGGYQCHELKWLVAIGVSIGVVVLGVGMSCSYAIREKRRLDAIKRRHFKQHGGFLLFEEMKFRQQGEHLSFTLFTKEKLEEATNGFDERHVLGKGGNGIVYRGDLRDGRTVAIKRCKVAAGDDERRQRREFGKEALILSQVNHRNIVKLYGCCLEVEVPMLVYQFIPNGTLYELIHGGDAGTPPPFAVRLKIAHEAAEALAYLHSTASPPIIHGDVKSPNILLDECYAAKVSDFGASALASATDDEAHLVTLVQGTCGYLDPEYMQTCRLTDKSDVYSFGVVLLELLTGRKALALASHFLAAVRDGKLDELVDPRIKGEVSDEVLGMVAALAKRCLEMSGEKRPSMREVAEELDRTRKLCRRVDCLGEIAHSSILVCDR